MTSGGVDFPVYPTSWGRLFILTKLHRLQDGETCSWWNNAVKIQVTKDQLNDMLVAVDEYIESLYEYEIPKIVEINNCTTIAELSAIVL